MSGETLFIKGLPEGVSGHVYSVSGRKVANLPTSSYDGTITWNATNSDLSSGIYIVNLQDAQRRNYFSDKFILHKTH